MTDYKICSACGERIPSFNASDDLISAVATDCHNRQYGLALARVKSESQLSKSEAEIWVNHLDKCDMEIDFSSDDQKIVDEINLVFGQFSQPEQFADPQHCDECAWHNTTLKAQPREKLLRRDLGSIGWDPISFIEPEGIAYLMPTLAKYALAYYVKGYEWYGPILALNLIREGENNPFLMWCNLDQRKAVFHLIQHINNTHADLIKEICWDKEFLEMEQLWRQDAT